MRYKLLMKQMRVVRFCLILIVVLLLAGTADFALAVEGKIVFTSKRDGEKAVYVMDGDGGSQSRVADGAYPAWHPDGQSISFLYEGDLWLTDFNGSSRENLTNGGVSLGSCVPVSWSPRWQADCLLGKFRSRMGRFCDECQREEQTDRISGLEP